MPQIKSRRKHIRQTEKRTLRNRRLKQEIAKSTRAVLDAARSDGEEEIQQAMNRAYKAIDKASRAGVFHARRGDRKKSLLARQVAELQAE
ncbi:MAG: 30S ribosomal protein S20 [Armatimonadetes bacterium]|nr:30S ribosomal protein S20 [Armatimonadota bacterium]